MTLSITHSVRTFVNGTLGRSTRSSFAGSTPRSDPPSRSLSARLSLDQAQENVPTPLIPRQLSPGSPPRPTPLSPPPSGRRRSLSSTGRQGRGGSHSHFSFSSVSNLFDAMWQRSVAHPEDSERSEDGRTGRERTRETAKAIEHNEASLTQVSRGGWTLHKLGDVFESESDVAHLGDGWKEFKKGNSLNGGLFLVRTPPHKFYRHLYVSNIL